MPASPHGWLRQELLAYFNSRVAASEEEAWAQLAPRAGGEDLREPLGAACRALAEDGLLERCDGRQWRIVRLRDPADTPEELPACCASYYRADAGVSVRVNRYERDRAARQRCIGHHGARCAVCDFDFEQVYGALGQGCVRVHHLVPAAQLGPDYRLDPVRDLRPVCANCHHLLHRTEPPCSIEHLRGLLRRQQARSQDA